MLRHILNDYDFSLGECTIVCLCYLAVQSVAWPQMAT